jgi:hypothetical protein
MTEDPARRRFMVVQTMRWAGVALVMLGLLVIDGRIDLPREAGYVLFAVGIIDALVMPTVLARRWKSPPP